MEASRKQRHAPLSFRYQFHKNAPKEWRVPPAILWDFVDFRYVTSLSCLGSEPNHFGFSRLRETQGMPPTWHPVCSLIGNLQDWLPGVAGTDPRLGYRFWGVN